MPRNRAIKPLCKSYILQVTVHFFSHSNNWIPFLKASISPAILALILTWIAMNDGGATPKKVPIQNGQISTPTRGDTMLISQLGSRGVILKES